MASIFSISKNKYRVQFTYNGTRYSKVFKTKKECKEWVTYKTNLLNNLDLSNPNTIDISKVTFKEMLLRFKEEKLQGDVKKQDRNRVDKTIRDFPKLVNTPVIDLTKADFRDWIAARVKEVSGSSIAKEKSHINMAFKTAINEWDWNVTNPLRGLPIPPKNPPRDRLITPIEIETMLNYLGYIKGVPLGTIKIRVGAAFIFALETALRMGEICKLKWTEVSSSGNVIKVKAAKTRAGIREVPLSSKARSIIQQCRLDNEEPLVFRLKTHQLDSNFRKYRAKAKLSGFTFHDSRANAITALAKKLDILDLARVIGHKNIQTLMIYYREGAEALVDRLG